MPSEKRQTDGIRRKKEEGSPRTISLVNKKAKEKTEGVSIRREPPVIKKEPAPEPPKTATSASVPSRESAFRDIPKYPLQAGRPPVSPAGSLPKEEQKKLLPEPSEEEKAAFQEDKVSSWFSRKKGTDKSEENDFYTGVGFSEEEQEGAKKRHTLFIGVLVGAGVFLGGGILLSTVFARATVIVKPKVEAVEVRDVSLTFDTSAVEVLSKQKILPAAKLEFSKHASQEFESTGTKTADFKARGIVQIFNTYNTLPQALLAQTRFLTGNGRMYRLPKAVTVPGAKVSAGKIVPQYIEAELVADVAGEAGNLSGEVTLQIPGFQGTPKYGKFYAVAPKGFSGGARGTQKIVTPDDQKRASEAVTKAVYADLEKESATNVPPDFTVIDALRSIEITNVSVPSADSVGEKFSATADATARLIVFRESDVVSFLRMLILGSDEKRDVIPESVDLTYTVASADYVKGRAAVVLRGSIQTQSVISDGEITSLIQGKSAAEAQKYLDARQDITSSKISLFPPWLWKIPSSSDKVRITHE